MIRLAVLFNAMQVSYPMQCVDNRGRFKRSKRPVKWYSASHRTLIQCMCWSCWSKSYVMTHHVPQATVFFLHSSMSAKNRGVTDKPYPLPPNPSWIVFERSDGDQNLWPDESKTRQVIDVDGHVNYFRPVDIDEASSIRWRHGVALAVARQLELPGRCHTV
jgi:hypothetical protein